MPPSSPTAWTTDSLQLAAVLLCHGYMPAEIRPSASKPDRVEFVYDNSQELNNKVKDYFSGGAEVIASQYEAAKTQLMSRMRSVVDGGSK